MLPGQRLVRPCISKNIDILNRVAEGGKDQQKERQRDHALDQIAIRQAAGVLGNFTDPVRILDKIEGTEEDEQRQGQQKEDGADYIDECFAAQRPAIVEKIDPDMRLVDEGDRNPEENNDGEEMPFQLLLSSGQGYRTH